MFRLKSRVLLASCLAWLVACLPVASRAADDLDPLLKAIPPDANVLIVVRVQEVLKSELAVAGNWARKQEDAYLAGADAIPPWLVTIVRGTNLHLEDSSIGWSVAAATSQRRPDLQKIAEHYRGSIEKIGKAQVVRTSGDDYFTLLGPQTVGSMSPAHRQETARWLRHTATATEVKLPAYLATAATNPAPLVIAIDTQDMLDPAALRSWLQGTKTLTGKTGQAESVAHVYDNLLGITLAVNIAKQATATLTLNFAVPVGANATPIKQTLVEYLAETGAAFDDLEHAEVKASEKHVTLTTPLSDVGLRRIVSLVVTPNPATLSSGEGTPPAPVPQGEVDARKTKQASKRYYDTIEQTLADISKKNARANNYERTAVWHDAAARTIAGLSLQDVNPELADYGATVAQRLRALAASLRGVAMKVSTDQGRLVVNYDVTPGQVGGWGPGAWWGAATYTPSTWHATSNLQEVRAKQAEAIQRGADEREQIWQAIEADRDQMRRKMLAAFGEDFTTGK